MDKLSVMSNLISEYNMNVSLIRRKIDDYLSSINEFMQDSGKRIVFSGVGNLRFTLEKENYERERGVGSLSSGEIQILVILTHLYFNPEVERANVFIIDEPELSLHVQWQEKFADGIMDASQATQFILATHSPSVILNRTNWCKEVSQL